MSIRTILHSPRRISAVRHDQMNSVAVCRKLVAMVVVALSGLGVLVATSATTGAAAAGGCAGKAYVANERDGTVSVISTATDAVSAPITVGKGATGVAICPARSAHKRPRS
jgi:YVTN family beta-propeller protein